MNHLKIFEDFHNTESYVTNGDDFEGVIIKKDIKVIVK